MTTLILGVIDILYENEGEKERPNPITKKGKVRKSEARRLQREMDGHDSKADGPTTTSQVAEILEEKYGVMNAFYNEYQDSIQAALIHSLEGALEDLYLGSPITDPLAEASQEIQSGFQFFLASAEIETMGIEGVPTQAALERRSLRFKGKKGPNKRPSFIDTGLYQASMRAWTE